MTKSSTEELVRLSQLKLLEAAKEISKLQHQVPMRLIVNGIEVFKYTADFVYRELGQTIIEEYKGYFRTRDGQVIQIRALSAQHPDYEFRIVGKRGIIRRYKAGKCIRSKIAKCVSSNRKAS